MPDATSITHISLPISAVGAIAVYTNDEYQLLSSQIFSVVYECILCHTSSPDANERKQINNNNNNNAAYRIYMYLEANNNAGENSEKEWKGDDSQRG